MDLQHAQERLRKSEANLKKAEKIAKLGNWEWNILTNEIIWSDEVYRIYGIDPVTDKPSFEVVIQAVAPEYRDRFVSAVENAVKHNVPFEGEYRMIGLDGAERFTHTIGEVVRDPEGRPLSMFGVVQDITRRRKVEDALRKAERLYQELVETAQDLIWQCDTEGRYTYVNGAWETVLGYGVEEMLCRKFSEFQDAETARRDTELFGQLLQGGMVKGYETVHRSKSGGDVHLVFNAIFVRDEQGAILGTRGTAHDITERKRMEEKLRTSEEKHRFFLENGNDAVLIHSFDKKGQPGPFTEVNDLACAWLGYSREELARMTPRDLDDPQHQDHIPRIMEKLKTEGNAVFETVWIKKDGGRVPVEISTRLLDLRKQKYIVSLGRDISERKRVEEALRENEEKFSKVFHQAPLLITLSDIETGRLIDVNDRYLEISGFARGEVIGRTVLELGWISADDRSRMVQTLRERGRVSGMELSVRRKDGTAAVCLYSGETITVNGQQRLLSIAQDITERKQAEQKLRTSEERLKESQQVAKIGSWSWDIVNNRLDWSDETFRRFDKDPKTFTPTVEYYVNLIHPDDRAAIQTAIEDSLNNDTPYHIQPRIRNENGREWVLEGYGLVERDARGTPIRFAGTVQDITARKQVEEKARESEEFVRSILDTVDEGFIVIDRDYRILTANKAYCGQAGLPSDEVNGRHCYAISHKASRPCHEEGEACAVRQVFATGEPHSALHKHIDQEGNVLYVETKGYPIRDASGAVTSVIETINNITEKHLLEEERLKMQKLESIGTLAGGIAHDFNNLLQGVFGFISLARLKCDDKEQAFSALEEAEKALQLSVKLTNQLLTFSKGGKPVKYVIDLRPVIENAAKFALSGSRSDCRFDMDPGLWSVDADGGQVGQVIQNIVLNADQAMPLGGRVAISARNLAAAETAAHPVMERGDHIVITIEDQGAGIPEEYLDKIFDPYFTTKAKGSGLGLATSYSIIRNHGGRLEVRSSPGKGSTFRIYLPAVRTEAALQEKPQQIAMARKARVLVMDDEVIIRRVAQEMLGSLGHAVAVAEHGESAVEQYRRAMAAGNHFDIVILDLTIRGGMGGKETLRKLREIDPGVKAVVSSGYSDDDETADYRTHGFRSYLKKPYNMEHLQDVLNRLMA